MIDFLSNMLLDLPRAIKRLIAVSVDTCLCVVATWASFALRLNELVLFNQNIFIAASISVLIGIPLFISFGLYRAVFRYYGATTIMHQLRALCVYAVIFSCIIVVIGLDGIPRAVGLIQPLVLLVLVCGFRSFVQFSLGSDYRARVKLELLPKAIIYGAGIKGRQFLLSCQQSLDIDIVGFLDDDKNLHGQILNGKMIFSPEKLDVLMAEQNISYVLLALSSSDRIQRNRVLKKLAQHNVAVRSVPSVAEIANGPVLKPELMPLDLLDLLNREPVHPDSVLLSRNVVGKTIVVSGAGGSIGSELCRQIFRLNCTNLLLIDFNEFALYSINAELVKLQQTRNIQPDINIIPILLNIENKSQIKNLMKEYKVDVVFHAAAYKHVSLVENNLLESMKNNVFASIKLAEAALDCGVKHFVFVSTDKAVRPSNVMGATKRLAEIALQAIFAKENACNQSNLAIVRFGNVLGSSGSVLPIFSRQIEEGGPITIRHPEISRYFMSIPEAAQLVIQAGAMAANGNVFVLDMGEPVKIVDLATRMVELSGYTLCSPQNLNGDIEIVFTGLVPGEKLNEELLIGKDCQPTQHPKISREQDSIESWDCLQPILRKLQGHLSQGNEKMVLENLILLVKEYTPSEEIMTRVQKRKSTKN